MTYVSDTASAVAAGIGNELSLLPGTVANLPSAIGATAMSGEMADSLAGAVDGGINAVAGSFGIRRLSRGPIYGNEQAFANGRTVGQGAVLAAETAVVVYATIELAPALMAAATVAAPVALALAGRALPVGYAGIGAVALDAALAAAGIYMAANTVGGSRERG